MWLEEFHFDGLRLDAADMIFDLGARHILRAIKEAADAAGERRGWPAVVTAESDLNDPRLLYPAERGGYGLDVQWMDDYHHAAHAFLTGERHGYYADFGEASQLAKVLEQPYVYDGDYSPFRDRKHGARPEGLAGDRFVVFLQNHDQVGNRASGDRLSTLMKSPGETAARLPATSCCLRTCRFCSWAKNTARKTRSRSSVRFAVKSWSKAVREGRRREYSAHDRQGEVPDPDAQATFASARLSWSWPEGTARAGLRRLYRDLLTARREWPALRDFVNRSARLIAEPRKGSLRARTGQGQLEPGPAAGPGLLQPRRPAPAASGRCPGGDERSCSAPKPWPTVAAATDSVASARSCLTSVSFSALLPGGRFRDAASQSRSRTPCFVPIDS